MFTIYKWVRGITLYLALCLMLLLINVFQILSLAIVLFNQNSFVKFNIFLKECFGRSLAKACQLCGNKLEITGDTLRRENSIFIANHQSFLDIPVLWTLASDAGMAGWINWFAKASLKYIPGLGWGLVFAQAILLKRNWSQDAKNIHATFQKLLDANVPFLVTIFPEGTRMKASKFKLSKEFSKSRGTQEFDRVLFPRPKGVWATVQGLNSRLSAIYDINIAYPSVPPPPLRFFTHGGNTIKVHITRIDKSELPTIEREFNQWIQNRFVEKDRWMKEHSGYDPATIFSA